MGKDTKKLIENLEKISGKKIVLESVNMMGALAKGVVSDSAIIEKAMEVRQKLAGEGYTVVETGFYFSNFTANQLSGPAIGFGVGSDSFFVTMLETGRLVKYGRKLIESIIKSGKLEAPQMVKLNLQESSDQKRYVATIEIYAYGKDDTDALANAKKIAHDLDMKYDNHAKVQSFGEMPFGGMGRDFRPIILSESLSPDTAAAIEFVRSLIQNFYDAKGSGRKERAAVDAAVKNLVERHPANPEVYQFLLEYPNMVSLRVWQQYKKTLNENQQLPLSVNLTNWKDLVSTFGMEVGERNKNAKEISRDLRLHVESKGAEQHIALNYKRDPEDPDGIAMFELVSSEGNKIVYEYTGTAN